jgi:hypothetical protein
VSGTSTEGGRPGGRKLASRVQELANRAHRLCHEAQRPDLGDALRREGDRYQKAETTVVVLGEEKRGKSTLVNALLGDDVVPVDADVSTGTYIAITHGEHRTAYVYVDGGEQPVPVDLADLVSWVTVGGTHARERTVRGAVVTLDAPFLASGVHLVDTPGVGGLDGSLAAVTLAALPTADVVVVVLDGGVPLSASELRFLQQATGRVACVVFALGRADLHPGWREIADADRALLAQHAPRLADAPMLGVSGYLSAFAVRAAAAGDEALAAEAASRSGIGELSSLLRDLAAQGRAVKLANLVRLVEAVVDDLEAVERIRLGSATDDRGAQARLEDQQRRLEVVADASARWRVDLDYEVKRLSYDFESKVEVGITAIERRCNELVAKGGKDLTERLATDLERELSTLWGELNDFVRAWFAATLDLLLEKVALDLPELSVGGLRTTPDLIGARTSAAPDQPDLAGALLQYYPVVFAVSMPTSVASMASTLMGGGVVAMNPFLVLAGLGLAGTVFMARRTQTHGVKDRRQAAELVRGSLGEARRQLVKQLGQELNGLRRMLDDEVGSRLQDRRRLLERQLKEGRELARQDASERQRARQIAEQRLEELEALRASASSLHEDVLAAIGAGGATP